MSNQPEYYQDHEGKWRWRIIAANHKVTDAASEGFASKQKAKENYQLNHS